MVAHWFPCKYVLMVCNAVDKCLNMLILLLEIVALSLSIGIFDVDLVLKMPFLCVIARIHAIGDKEASLKQIGVRTKQSESI